MIINHFEQGGESGYLRRGKFVQFFLSNKFLFHPLRHQKAFSLFNLFDQDVVPLL